MPHTSSKAKSGRTAFDDLMALYASDVIQSDGMQQEKLLAQHGSGSCYDHSVAVARVSVRIAHALSIRTDIESLIRGALLHDYFLYDWRDRLEEHRKHGRKHAGRALINAKRDFHLSEISCDIIEKHMFPLNIRPPRYRESYIVTLADKICAVREFAGAAGRPIHRFGQKAVHAGKRFFRSL